MPATAVVSAIPVTFLYRNKNQTHLCCKLFTEFYSRTKNHESAMSSTRPAILIISCLICALLGMPASAMDMAVAPSAATTAASKAKRETRKLAKRKVQSGTGHRKITIYSLFNDPLFKRSSASTRPQDNVMGLGTGFSHGISTTAPVAPAKSNAAASAGISPMLESPDNGGVGFDCRDKPAAGPLRREVTACYVHRLDKAWRTQTYVTKGLADSSPGWGGGLAVGYAY